ncbi:hypothetical protein BY996DRAFT_4583350 [Phakopsora pachyrhizi]|nr:hypothetical protein BY996DRAFT_4583350 [Phakopsora pachyrhizi]
MKRPRVTQMFGRNDSTSVTISPANTPSCSQPGSPPAKSPKASLNGSLATKISPFRSNQSGDQLQHSKFSIQPLSRNQSMDMLILPKPAEPSHGAELFGFLADSRASKKTYGIGRTFKEDNQDARLLMPINTNNQTDSFSSKKLMPSLSSTKFLSASSKFQARETYSDLRKKWGVDEDDEDDLDSPRQDLQTISFQRAMGSSKKMMDELIYLLGGLTDGQAQSDLNLQRSSSVELVKKLKGQTFLYLLQSTGMFEKVYETLRSVGSGEGQDLVLDMSLLVFISLICCSDPKQMEPLIRITPKGCNDPLSVESDCLQVLSKVSQSPSTYQDPKKFKQNLTRQTKRLLSEVEEVIQSSSLGKHLPISSTPSLLALFSLARIAGFSPRPGLIPQRAIVHSGALSSIMNSLQFHCDQLECDFVSYIGFNKSLDFKIILQNISYCMDVIETCTVCEEDSFKVISNFRESIPPRLSKLVSICRAVAIQKEIETASIGLDILIGTLRSMVNITNETSTWSERLATPSVMETIIGITQFCRDGYDYSSNIFEYENDDCNNQNTTTEKIQKVSMSVGEIFFDLLCVTLALLTNLIEQSLNGVKLLKGTRKCMSTHRSSIASHPKCTLECLCPDAITGYESMLLLYSDPPCSKPEEIELVKGSISLIINLCLLDSQTSSNGKEGTGRDEDLHPNESLIVETWQNITILNPQILNADEFFKDLKKCSIFDKGREENCNIKEGKIFGQRRTASSNGGRTDDDIEDSISIEDEKGVERMKVLKEDKCLVDDEVLKLYEFLKNSWKRLKAHLI